MFIEWDPTEFQRTPRSDVYRKKNLFMKGCSCLFLEFHGKDSWKFLGIECHGFWGHGVECHGIRFKECHAKHYISIDKTCHWNERIKLTSTKHCNNTEAYYMNMRVILLLHLFNISPTKTLDLNYIAYEGLDKRTKGNAESSSFIYTLPCIKKHHSAPCEARTHDLQIMRLTRCLTAPTRHVLWLG
jgi:hypothetical protein